MAGDGDFVGLQIDNRASCGAAREGDDARCVLPHGHEGQHQADGDTAPQGPACPDCDGPMEVDFQIIADDEATALRVFLSYQALKHFSAEDMVRLMKGHHVHLVADGECSSEHEPE